MLAELGVHDRRKQMPDRRDTGRSDGRAPEAGWDAELGAVQRLSLPGMPENGLDGSRASALALVPSSGGGDHAARVAVFKRSREAAAFRAILRTGLISRL
jgi:hypothetical protein